MVDILKNPGQLKTELKDKWLDYYQTNRSWLQHYMDDGWCDSVDSVEYDGEELENLGFDTDYTPCRPECYFIIGVMSVLEPSVQGVLACIASLTTNSEKVTAALGLDFDPEIELKKRSQQLEQKKSEADSQYLDQIREEIRT